MLDVHLRWAAGRRLPGRHADGHELLLRPDPRAHPRQVRRGARADHAGVGRRASRSPSTASTTSCATSTAGRSRSRSRTRRSTSRAAARSRRGTSASTTTTTTRTSRFNGYLRGQVAARRLLGARRRARQGRLALPCGLRPDHLRGRHRRGGRDASTPSTSCTSSTAACTSTRRFADPPGYRTIKTIKAGALAQLQRRAQQKSSRSSPGRSWSTAASSSPAAPRPCASAWRTDQDPARRPRVLPAAHRQHAGLEDAATPRSCSPRRSCPTCGTCGRSGRTTTAGGCHPLDDRLRPERDCRRRRAGRSSASDGRR